MLRVMDGLVILFIYANVLFPRITLASMQISKLLFVAILLAYAGYSINRHPKIPAKFIQYFVASISMICALGAIGLVLGNRLEDIAEFIVSLLILLLIPIFCVLLERYPIERYIQHIVNAAVILAGYIVLLYAYFSQFPTWNPAGDLVIVNHLLASAISYQETC